MNNARYTIFVFLGLERLSKYKLGNTVLNHFLYGYPFNMCIEEVKHHYPKLWFMASHTDKEYQLYRLIHETL